MLGIIVDENIAFADKAFDQFGKVNLMSGREINNAALKDTDVLIVRSITNVDEDLLKNTPVKFVGTATIGTDHIDLDYLKNKNIFFADAKGCNAYSVSEYIIAALLSLSVQFNFRLNEKSIGIVGVGNVGSKVATFAEALGMTVVLNDPPLQRQLMNSQKVISKDPENFRDEKSVQSIRLLPSVEVTNEVKKESLQKNIYEISYVELDEILKCDIVTLHTPLNSDGIDKTYHLFNNDNLNKLKDGAILINSSRGAVINNLDLLTAIEKKNLNVVLDVWENEPDINIELVKSVLIATPHIAGYSYEGKVNGTKMIYESLCEYLGEDKAFRFDLPIPQESTLLFNNSNKFETGLNDLVSNIYSINDDDERMRKILTLNEEERISYFDLLRKNYPKRREFNNYTIESSNLSKAMQNILKKLRFKLST